jgi:hypothetical protein
MGSSRKALWPANGDDEPPSMLSLAAGRTRRRLEITVGPKIHKAGTPQRSLQNTSSLISSQINFEKRLGAGSACGQTKCCCICADMPRHEPTHLSVSTPRGEPQSVQRPPRLTSISRGFAMLESLPTSMQARRPQQNACSFIPATYPMQEVSSSPSVDKRSQALTRGQMSMMVPR